MMTIPNHNIRIVREAERKHITSISRAHAWQLEQQGRFPARIFLGNRSVGWHLQDLLDWVQEQPLYVDMCHDAI
ncbi:MAG: AlpA family phage regulatory protein [Aliivibrio sp.]|uniref:helix-turn-helix transcriptional regulator n=1 Tax=Aliivibrio sp. TaxID=1872443 RepID=UPI001A459410|nr:AlpA family phage regulatory protein [Aliivibrio sp.]